MDAHNFFWRPVKCDSSGFFSVICPICLTTVSGVWKEGEYNPRYYSRCRHARVLNARFKALGFYKVSDELER